MASNQNTPRTFSQRGGDTVSEFDFKKNWDKLSEREKHFMEKAERRVNITATKAYSVRKRIRGIGLGLAVFTGFSYLFTMKRVKQEDFLDELPPETFVRSSDKEPQS